MADSISLSELKQIQERVVKARRASLDLVKPQSDLYAYRDARATRIIRSILSWSKVGVPVIAIFAGIASAIRTIQAASEIYLAAGSHPVGVALAAIAFTLSVEGTLFVIALAQEGERLKHRRTNAVRHVLSLKAVWHRLQVFIGSRAPLPYDQLPDRSNMELVMGVAFTFAIAANAYMGFRPLLAEIGRVSLQQFFATLWTSPAHLQLTFILDAAGILFPPLMALTAGHLTARFAAEVAEESQAAQLAFEQDMEVWRKAYTNPLETDEGKELLEHFVQERLQAKAARKGKPGTPNADFLAVQSSPNGSESPSATV